MKRWAVGRLAALVVLAVTDIAGPGSFAQGQAEKPDEPARDRNSARSSPPDMTPYIRPVIPEDLMKTPSPQREGDTSRPTLNDRDLNSQGSSHQDGSLPPAKR
jgi:hypothetical protein